MARNPSRPLPEVKNQLRPVSDWLGHISVVSNCPYNEEHSMKSHKLMRHIPKCEERHVTKTGHNDKKEAGSTDEFEKCPFNNLHRYPRGKREDHFRECKARAMEIIARLEAGESLDDIDNRYACKVKTPTTTSSDGLKC